MNEYARSLVGLSEGKECIESLSSFCIAVGGLAKCKYEREGDKVTYEVIKCPLAPLVHPKLRHGYKDSGKQWVTTTSASALRS